MDGWDSEEETNATNNKDGNSDNVEGAAGAAVDGAN